MGPCRFGRGLSLRRYPRSPHGIVSQGLSSSVIRIRCGSNTPVYQPPKSSVSKRITRPRAYPAEKSAHDP